MAGLAGCVGGGDGNGDSDSNGGNNDDSGSGDGGGNQQSTTISLGLGAQGTVSATTGQALQSVVSNVGESVELTGQTTAGFPPNVFLFNDNQIDGYTSASYVHWLSHNDLGAFAERSVDNLGQQGFTLALIQMHILAVEGSGIETYDDLAGEDVWLFPPAWGMHDLTKRLFKKVGLWSEMESNVSPIGIGDVAGAVEEGRVKAIAAFGLNRNSMGGLYLDILSRAEFNLVEMSDEFKAAVEEQPGTIYETVESEALYGDTDETLDADEIGVYNYDVNLYFSGDIPAAPVKELCQISHNNMEALKEAEPRYLDHGSIENMTIGITDAEPVHQGAAAFFKENDEWKDSWEEG
ncbi:hypothetical protein NKF06_11265 [Haloferax sp. AB510]|uniref:TAXI family TRAP transporter solute-binding subunit n=1 Tax=Haloferax sp. AB510 TaxID=2934172 RepID=UPI00209C5B24|nr:TAXI family TRAP transporter solute-binding subunit [Haloferax sp. AB510]MCO8267151.1 hypothetical protein [Haloferax sp. AB510]